MARLIDPKSKRQRGFAMLETVDKLPPALKIKKLMGSLNIGKSYATSIIATHRREGKAAGKFVTVHKVLDVCRGKTCDPFISSRDVPKNKPIPFGEFESVPQAKTFYKKVMRNKIVLSSKLKTS